MESAKKNNLRSSFSHFYISAFLLILIYIFEFFSAAFLIPNYIPFRISKILLAAAALLTPVWTVAAKKRKTSLELIAAAFFFFVRIYEVLNIMPRIHRPEILMSLLIIMQFISVFIIIYDSQFLPHFLPAIGVLLCALLYQILYFKKLHDLSALILILTIASSTAIFLISRLLKLERGRKLEIRKLYKEELELKNKLAVMRARMLEQEKGFSMSLMTAGIAHELGNPINHLQGNMTFLERHLNSLFSMIDSRNLIEDEKTSIEKIRVDCASIIDYSHEGFNNITGVISNMKKLYGRGHRGIEITDVKDLLTRTIQFFRSTINSIDYMIETEFEDKLFAEIIQGEYYIVFTNLLNNAVESFVHDNEIPNKIRIESSSDNGWIKINICDNGGGIEKEDLDKILDPFFSTKDRESNLGLGLALCNEIIKNDGNKFEINSVPGEGTIVTVFLKEADN